MFSVQNVGNLMSLDLSSCRKYEEIFPPELNEFVFATDSTYTKKELIRMEHVLLRVLDFKMAAPTTNQFLHLLMSVQPVSAVAENLALVSKINSSNTSQTTDLYQLPLSSVFHFPFFIW